jgi:hypothetical protein
VAPIHFPTHSRHLPLPQGLCMHTHAIPLLADRALALPFLVIFPLIVFLLICTIFARRVPGLCPSCPFHFTSAHLIISWTPYLAISPWHCHPLPLPYFQLVTQFPFTLTIASVCDSVPPLPLPYYLSLTQSSFCLPVSVLPLTAWSVLMSLNYINPMYCCSILQLESTWFFPVT